MVPSMSSTIAAGRRPLAGGVTPLPSRAFLAAGSPSAGGKAVGCGSQHDVHDARGVLGL